MARGTLEVGRIVPILFGAFRGRFELYITACAPLKIDKNFKINHPNVRPKAVFCQNGRICTKLLQKTASKCVF
jgi:hypothetical protein